MSDRYNNIKTPESNREAPAGLKCAPFFVTLPFPPFDLPRPSTMPPRTLPENPIYRAEDNPYSFPSFEGDSQQAPVYNESFMNRAMYSSPPMIDPILASSIFSSHPEASQSARPTKPANSRKYQPVIFRGDEERAAELREFHDLYDHMSRQEPERKRSPSLMSTDESDSDYFYPDTESESESEFSEEEERNSSPVPGCTDDESDGDYTDLDHGSESDSDSDSGSEPEAEPCQEQGNEMSLDISEELRTPSPPGFAWSRPHIPSWNDLGPRNDDMLYNNLYGLVHAPPISPYLPSTAPCTPTPQEQEQNRSSSPMDDDTLSTLGQALDKASDSLDDDSLSTLSGAMEKALEKHQPEDVASAKPGLSQDLGKKVHSSLSAYDSNMAKLRKDIDEHCDRIRERCDRLEREKRNRDDAVPPAIQEWVDAVFPGPDIPVHEREKVKAERVHSLAEREREQVRLERCRRLAERYRERFGILGNAVAGPSQEREKETSLSSKLDEMIRQKREKLRDLQGDKVPEEGRVQDLGRACRVADAAWELSFDARPRLRLPIPKPNNAVGMSLEETGEEMDVLPPEHRVEEEKDALPDYETDMELGDDLFEGQASLPDSPSSCQGQKRKRTDSFLERSFFENFEKMRQHVQEGVGREMKLHKKDGQSFEECMNRLYPAESEIWKIDDEPIQVRSSKSEQSRSGEDLGNGERSSSKEYRWDEKRLRGSEDFIDGLSNGGLPDIPPFVGMSSFAGMPPMRPMSPMVPMPPMPAFAPFAPFPTLPTMPNDSLLDIGPKRYPISRPAFLSLPEVVPCYYAVSLATSYDHEPWRPETEILEAVSDKPFSEWDDITGVREFIHKEIARAGLSKMTIEACRVKGEENVRLMVFVLERVDLWGVSPSWSQLTLALSRISDRLSVLGINDVKVEIWETDFHLQVI